MTSTASLNSKLMYLPLKELQIYLNNLEVENEKLKTELTTFSRFNCILENIRRSSNKGFNALQIIDRNKCCACNEHLNGPLRRVAQESDIELRVWQEQYDKLMLTTKKDYMATYDDDHRSVSHSPRSSTGVVSPVHGVQSPESEHSMSSNSNNTNDSMYVTNEALSPTIGSRTESISMDSTNDSGFRSDYSDRSDQSPRKDSHRPNGINESVVRCISQSPPSEESMIARSTPLVVYESRKDSRLVCDWPNCNRVFVNEDILTHHRRNHIRKSIYSCEFCSTRLLSKDELDSHMKTHILKSEPEFDKEVEEAELVVEEEDDEMSPNDDIIDIENSSEAVNLSYKSHNGPTLNPITALANIQRNDKLHSNALTFQTVLYERLTAKSSPPPPAINYSGIPLANTGNVAKITPQMRSDEYKRTRYSGVGRYRCPWPDCGYTPHFLRDLRRHMFKHTGDKKHKCDYPGCDFVSVWKTSLLQHQRKKHFAVQPINTNDNSFNARIAV